MNADMKRLRVIFFMLGILLLAGGLAQAVPITIQITGIVTGIRDLEAYPYDEAVLVGDSFTGTYTYDSATIDSSSQSDIGRYVHNSPYGFDISLGGFDFKTAESHVDQFEITVVNNLSLRTEDYYQVRSDQNAPLSTGLNVTDIHLSLSDDTGTALSSTVLPSIAPSINAWSRSKLFIGCGGPPGGNSTFAVWVTVTQAEIVPEPTLEIAVDIQPGSCPNPLRVNFIGSGVFPVAIVGSADFDVTTINPDTVTLAGVAPLRSKEGDVSTPGDVCELGPDGTSDLVLKFDRQAVLDALEDIYGTLGDLPNREELTLTLLAETYEGEPVTGTDSLVILNRGGIKRKK